MIKKRNLDPSLVQWIMAQTGLGPGIGKLHYVAPAASATSLYSTQLGEMGVNEISASIAAAEAKMAADRNDCMLIAPGAYLVTTSLTWDKSQSHALGLGGPNQRHCPTTATEGAVQIKNVTTTVDSIFHVTGNYCQFHNFQTMNTFSASANRCDFLIGARNIYFNGMRPRGGNGANQLNHADGGIPVIFEASSGCAGFTADKTTFGSAGNSARTVGPGSLLFEALAGAFSPRFNDCHFEMRCETSGSSNPSLIHLAGSQSIDRLMHFNRCTFYNFADNLSVIPDYVIVDDQSSTHMSLLQDCAMYGFDYWCNVATYCFTNTADAVGYGGKAITITTG